MHGVDPGNGWLYVSKTDNGDAFTRLVGLIGDFGGEVEGWPTERVRAALHSERYFHAIHFPRAQSISIRSTTPGAGRRGRTRRRAHFRADAGAVDRSCRRAQAHRHAGSAVRANHVVLCGNVQLGGLMPKIAATLIPMTTYVITTAPLGSRLSRSDRLSRRRQRQRLANNHYRVVGGDRLMWSGRMTTSPRDPRRYVRRLSADIKKTYPQLGDVAADFAWSGTLGNSIHRMPQIGELAPGLWLASGFGGHGLNTTAIAGTLIARAIIDGDQTWRQFTPFELVWAGGVLGRATAQIYYWMRRSARCHRRAPQPRRGDGTSASP